MIAAIAGIIVPFIVGVGVVEEVVVPTGVAVYDTALSIYDKGVTIYQDYTVETQ